ncbi:MAG: GNAT family N-acetyltransferase [Hyphomicrobiaceae bacterium]
MGVSRARLLAIEEAAVRSWPALQRMPIDGWLWRCTSGGSVRANTVATLAFSGADVEAAIDDVERLYRAAGVPSRFAVSEVSAPSDLDQRLAARGYQRGDDHVTMAKSVSACAVPPDTVALGAERTPEWMTVYLSGLTEDRRGVAPRILAGLPSHRMYFACLRQGRIATSGLSIADGQFASVQCMATAQEAQRQGGARAVLAAIEAWAAAQGCTTLYLQTGADNDGARALYRACGFDLAGYYHTRVLMR